MSEGVAATDHSDGMEPVMDYGHLISGVAKIVQGLVEDPDLTDNFTPHDYSHCVAVREITNALVESGRIVLTELERFILDLCVLVHDVGMIEEVAKNYFESVLGQQYKPLAKREIHEQISAWYMCNDRGLRQLFMEDAYMEQKYPDERQREHMYRSYARTASLIIKYHRRKENVEECPAYRNIGHEKVRSRLVACIVRMGDTLHVDSSRYDRKCYNMLQIGQFDRSARLHWLKSYLISSVVLDDRSNSIVVTIDLPEPRDGESEHYEDSEKARLLEDVVREDIFEDLIAVKPTMEKAYQDQKFFSRVRVFIDYIHGFDEELRRDIRGVLSDLDIVMSPNTSRVISRSLRSIRELTEPGNYAHNVPKYRREASLLRDQLIDFLESRKCHLGFAKVVELIKQHVRDLDDILAVRHKTEEDAGAARTDAVQQLSTRLRKDIDSIEQRIAQDREFLKSQGPALLAGKTQLYLFGYSQRVIDLLAEGRTKTEKEELRLYVFECAGKRQLSAGNDIEYSDGMHYSSELMRLGYENVSLMPDGCFASLLRNGDLEEEQLTTETALLVGTNGIETNGAKEAVSTLHSSGHLAMALVARDFGVPVIVAADSFKASSESEANGLNQNRQGVSWLAGTRQQIDAIQAQGIRLRNLRSDRLTSDEVDMLVCNGFDSDGKPTA